VTDGAHGAHAPHEPHGILQIAAAPPAASPVRAPTTQNARLGFQPSVCLTY